MTVMIHGKEYITVAERITAAGEDLIGVDTEVLFQEPVVIKATITTKKGTFSGISAANPSKSIEKESPYEVAESSAVGRALAFAGYETTNGIASAEEMQKIFTSSPKPTIERTQEESGVSADCPIHGDKLIERVSKKTGMPYWSHFLPDGSICFGRK